MSVTYGFYNSLSGDRKYNAEQMSSIFDGIIQDGVLQHVGSKLVVTASDPNALTVNVGTGRAWFDHTWTLNDAVLVLEIPTPESLLNRYDAVVLETDSSSDVRANSIKIVEGTPASTPNKPTLTNTTKVHQYPLAYVYVAAGATAITQANITNCVGTSACPYVTAPLESVSVDELYSQWEAQWNELYATTLDEMSAAQDEYKQAWTDWQTEQKASFDTWFNDLSVTLAGDVATDLTQRVIAIETELDGLADALGNI